MDDLIVYNSITGEIVGNIPVEQNIMSFFCNYPEEFKENLMSIDIENPPSDLINYKIINGKLIKKEVENISTEPALTNKELQERIIELENVIDILIGGVDNGL